MSAAYWIIGPGRVGLSLGSLLLESGGAETLLVVGRRPQPPDLLRALLPRARYSGRLPGPPPARTRVLLAVPDGAIAGVAAALAALGPPGGDCVALHLSGARPAAVLAPLAERGYAVGSLHPLQTVADPATGAERLRGACFAFEGDAAARPTAEAIVASAAGRLLDLHAADRARYHAACVFASNYLVACVAIATQLLAESTGIGRDEAARALEPLWRGAMANLETLGPVRALTGPVTRGDVETVRAHLAALDGGVRDAYAALARQALELGREAGLDRRAAAELEAALAAGAPEGTAGG